MPIGNSLRFQILRRDEFACYYCHTTGIPLTVDHVVPVSLGGDDDPTNLVAACGPCNSGKAAIPPDAGIVASVAEDAQRWANAMMLAADIRAQEHEERAIDRKAFDDYWNQWTYGADGATAYRPEDWGQSIDNFIKAGLTIYDLIELTQTAMARKVQPGDEWRYFCGCAWRRISELQAVARALLVTGQTTQTAKTLPPPDQHKRL